MTRWSFLPILVLTSTLAFSQDFTIGNRKLVSTTFVTLAEVGVTASCRTANCSTSVPLGTPAPTVTCPVVAGRTCTIATHVDVSLSVSAGDRGFLSGFTNVLGYVWQYPGQNNWQPVSFTFLNNVRNNTDNQQYIVPLSADCTDTTGDGCTIGIEGLRGYTSTTVRVDVFTP